MLGAIEQAEESSDAPAKPPRRRIGLWLLAAAGVIAAGVALAVLGPWDDGDSRDEVGDVAARFAEQLLSFRPDEPEATVDGVLALSSGSFAESYEQAIDAGLVDVLLEAGTRATAEVETVFVGPVDGDSAPVVVAVTVDRTTELSQAVSFATHLRLELVDGDEGWRVVDVTSLDGGSPGALGTDAVPDDEDDAPSSSTTTAPTPTTAADDAPDTTEG